MDKTNNLDIFMTDLADSIREATGETGSINAQSFSTRITGLGTGKQDKLVSGENIKTINGESILGSGDITIQGGGSYNDSEIREAISQLSAITNDFNSDIANLYDVKQDTLVSGTNIKTVNGQSILGSGNIEIGSEVSVITQTSNGIEALQPNVITIITKPLPSIYIDDFVISSSLHDEYTVIFSTGGLEPGAPSITLPDYVLWANGSVPTLEWHTVYEFSITRDFLTIVPEGGLNAVEQNVYKAVLTPFKSV